MIRIYATKITHYSYQMRLLLHQVCVCGGGWVGVTQCVCDHGSVHMGMCVSSRVFSSIRCTYVPL